MKNLRSIRQEEFAQIAYDKKNGLLHLASRFGKIKTCFNFIKSTDQVLVIYPKAPIKQSWIDESKNWEFDITNFTFSTTSSLKKVKSNKYDWVIWDEPQEVLSDKVLSAVRELAKNNNVIGLSGSLSKNTKSIIRHRTGLNIIAEYPTSLAIKEGVICDYKIHVQYIDLEPSLKHKYDWYTNKINDAINRGDRNQTKFFALGRMRLLYSSKNKLEYVKKIIAHFAGQRLIVFSHLTKFVDQLGIDVYHSKKKSEKTLEDFKNGVINQMATLDMISAGISFKKLNRAIVATFTSNTEELYQRINRITALEMDNPSKRAIVYIVCIRKTQEEMWLEKALKMFDPDKIKYR
jgi:superfamily II DNA or RNA helicase